MSPRLVLVARAAVFFALCVWMWAGPFYRQVLGGRNEIFRPWVMFSGVGLLATQVRFVQVVDGGVEVPLDRYALLAPDKEKPGSLRYVRDEAAVGRVARQLCRKLGEGADVRAYLKVAKRTGWRRVMKAETNLCAT